MGFRRNFQFEVQWRGRHYATKQQVEAHAVQFHEKTSQVETIRVSDEPNVDIGPDGTVYGIEMLNANEQLDPATPASWASWASWCS